MQTKTRDLSFNKMNCIDARPSLFTVYGQFAERDPIDML
jgi:hypothetical protein